jgi:two-component system, chemotaxis family, protein-glutamate methylesterase/glutaminase
MKSTRIVVVGTSAGGMDALKRLVAQLPGELGAAVFVVQHMSADSTAAVLVASLEKAGALACTEARDGERWQAGHIYVAPADQHLMVGKDKVMVTKGAPENRSRPAIDTLFRSAAAAHGSRVIGVLLTGQLDDGTAGLVAIKRCGGTCVVQDPNDAAYPDMPENATRYAQIDHCVPIAQMGALLSTLLKRPTRARVRIPRDIAIEARIAERVLSDLASVNALGSQVPFNCPGCGGVLWEISEDTALRYRCHTGHSYTAPVLLAEQTAKIEETLWVALRMFEERRNLLSTIATSSSTAHARSAAERAKESGVHIERIRAMLRSTDKARRPRA